ncbi:MAG: class I SAM-dependent methyltransferase [archaeon]
MSARYHNQLGKEYALSARCTPYFFLVQQSVGLAIKENYGNQSILVLDIGCGTGYTSEQVLKINKNAKVIAIDDEPLMISQAKKRLKKFVASKRINFVCADAGRYLLSKKDSSFDVVVSGLTIHNFADEFRLFILREVFRVLQNKGIFINLDKYYFGGEDTKAKLFCDQIQNFIGLLSKLKKYSLLQQWIIHSVEDQALSKNMNERAAKKQLFSCGFSEAKFVFRRGIMAVVVAKK